ncbi:hypothetical protein DSAG12_02819 [Promethearchaeum syntrophicum]|uniref:Uncharacterized protein n=1 Tax=Promethearchaeum syntrophicum TaxID=2594042 RepID=A0A5B9DDN2_9ARCH|nr:hypothetical protein [Candidatus Prometheoarchaeum syntrophicum]QEE16987.1 hypothetical protein DSAG12_02819 [Candidatus Prometheoarchaeum syntrophicum]
MKVKYLMYQCPNCHAFTHIAHATEPLKCKICGRSICYECVDLGMCTHCKNLLTKDEYQQLKSSQPKFSIVSCIFIGLVIFDIYCAIRAVSGLMFSNNSQILSGSIGFILGILPTIFLFYRFKKEEAKAAPIYESFKNKIKERQRI